MGTLVQDLQLNGIIPHDRQLSCVFKLPPGCIIADGDDDDALQELGEGNYFLDSRRQHRLSTVVAVVAPRTGRRTLAASVVPDGYWAATGFDLNGAASLVPGFPGEAAAPFYRLAPFPHEKGRGQDSRRCYYMNKGVPSIYPGTAPQRFGAPYASQGMYLEITDVRKVVHVYGAENGECESGAVGNWAYDEGTLHGVPLLRLMHVAVSDVFRPRAGDYKPLPPRIYRLADNTYWAPIIPRDGDEYDGIFILLP
jgi:hypothetical protein